MTIKKPLIVNAGQVEQLAAADSVIGAGGGVRFQYDSNTTIADPGSGKFRFNIPPATQIAISETDADGNNVASFLAALDDSSNAVHARLYIFNERTNSLFIYNVTGTNTDNGTWDTLSVGEILAGSLTNGDYVRIWAAYSGNDGATGATGSTGATGAAGRDAGLRYTYSTTTTASDPGSGTLRFDNTTLASATALYISETDGDSNGIASYLTQWGTADNTIRGYLFMTKDGSPSNMAIFQVTSSRTDNGSWDTFTVANVISSGSFSNNDVVKLQFIRNGDSSPALNPGCRLTLESHVPISISDQSAATTLYYTAWIHGGVPLYDGSRWAMYNLPAGQISIAVPTAVSSAKPYDVFCYLSSGTPTLETLAWTNNTSRATNIINTSSPYLYTKSGDATRLYVGTIYANTSGQCFDTLRARYVWNMFNRVERVLFWGGPGSGWTYNANGVWRYVAGGSAPSLSCVVGLEESYIDLTVQSPMRKSAGDSGIAIRIGIGRDVTNTVSFAPTAYNRNRNNGTVTAGSNFNVYVPHSCYASEIVPLGYHEYNWNEITNTNAVTLASDANTGTYQSDESGISGSIVC